VIFNTKFHRCDVILLNVYAGTEDKSDDSRDSINEELELVFD
jgi:hypothetical protein